MTSTICLMFLATTFPGALPAEEAREMLAIVRDGYRSHQQRIRSVVAEGTRAVESTVRDDSGQIKEVIKDTYAVTWKQLGNRIRYEEELIQSTRAGLETEEARKRLGKSIYLVLPDSYFVYYESSGVTDWYDRQRWDSSFVGVQRYVRLGLQPQFTDPGAFAEWLLEHSKSKGTEHVAFAVDRQDREGRVAVTLKCTQTVGEGVLEVQVRVDPARGFLPLEGMLSQRRDLGSNGRVGRVIQSIDPISSTEGIWFIKRATRKEFSDPAPPTFEMLDVTEFATISINRDRGAPKVTDFALHNLPITTGALVVDHRTSQGYIGDQVTFRYNASGIDTDGLARFLDKLADATRYNYDRGELCNLGNPEFYLYDSGNRLFLTEEPLCGVFALWSALLTGGRTESFENVAHRFSEIGPHGSSLEDIRKAAEALGLKAQAIRTQKAGLISHLDAGGSAVLHMAPHHFAAAVRLADNSVYVADYPSVRLTSWSDLEKQWSGNALFIGLTSIGTPAKGGRVAAVSVTIAVGVVLVGLGVLVVVRRSAKERSGAVASKDDLSSTTEQNHEH